MSQWTHVTGSIRINSIGWCMDYKRDVYKILNQAFKVSIPIGSEGPVGMKIFKTGHQDTSGGTIEWGSICFFADLRAYDNYEEIYNWIVSSISSLDKEYVRSMSIIIDVEYKGKYLITVDKDEKIVMTEILQGE